MIKITTKTKLFPYSFRNQGGGGIPPAIFLGEGIMSVPPLSPCRGRGD